MEVEESSDQTSTNSSNDNSLNYERQIWVVMNNTFLSFDKQIKQIKEIKLNKFQADQNAADFFKLTSYTVTVKYDNISLFLTSVLKVIAESDVSVWPKDRLKSQLFSIGMIQMLLLQV